MVCWVWMGEVGLDGETGRRALRFSGKLDEVCIILLM